MTTISVLQATSPLVLKMCSHLNNRSNFTFLTLWGFIRIFQGHHHTSYSQWGTVPLRLTTGGYMLQLLKSHKTNHSVVYMRATTFNKTTLHSHLLKCIRPVTTIPVLQATYIVKPPPVLKMCSYLNNGSNCNFLHAKVTPESPICPPECGEGVFDLVLRFEHLQHIPTHN